MQAYTLFETPQRVWFHGDWLCCQFRCCRSRLLPPCTCCYLQLTIGGDFRYLYFEIDSLYSLNRAVCEFRPHQEAKRGEVNIKCGKQANRKFYWLCNFGFSLRFEWALVRFTLLVLVPTWRTTWRFLIHDNCSDARRSKSFSILSFLSFWSSF